MDQRDRCWFLFFFAELASNMEKIGLALFLTHYPVDYTDLFENRERMGINHGRGAMEGARRLITLSMWGHALDKSDSGL